MTTTEREKQVAIAYEYWIMCSANGYSDTWDDFINTKAYLSIPPADDWIPVTERLPEPIDAGDPNWQMSAPVIISTEIFGSEAGYCYHHDTKKWINGDIEINSDLIAHWMPLPNPPKK